MQIAPAAIPKSIGVAWIVERPLNHAAPRGCELKDLNLPFVWGCNLPKIKAGSERGSSVTLKTQGLVSALLFFPSWHWLPSKYFMEAEAL